MSMLEAECTRCKETFVPHGTNPEDLIHCFTEAEEECGGIGVISGMWHGGDNTLLNVTLQLTPQEKHGQEVPDCDDPDCEFHHPEVIEL